MEFSRRAYEQGKRSADAADRSATAAERTLADQRRDAAERRAAEAEAAQPKVKLRNWGNAVATGIANVEPCGAVDEWPVSLSLRPGEAHQFMIFGDYENLEPTQVRVTWDGQEDPVVLPVP
ncbi:hypothetical protein [Streptomyces sp. NPDC057336]|uniref:hypothetical protein n=1 Tax=Streptomyces sp. NPDC057336 TaxID=3346102 RepID=UPI003635AEA5